MPFPAARTETSVPIFLAPRTFRPDSFSSYGESVNVVRGVDDVMATLHPCLADSRAATPPGPTVSGNFHTIKTGGSTAEAAALMLATGATRLIVIDHAGRPLGLVLRRWVRSRPGAASAAPRPVAPVA
jgi:CBS domain-containing protein